MGLKPGLGLLEEEVSLNNRFKGRILAIITNYLSYSFRMNANRFSKERFWILLLIFSNLWNHFGFSRLKSYALGTNGTLVSNLSFFSFIS